MWIIIASALISWVSPDPHNPIVRFLRQVTEPVLRPIRQILPTYQTGIDFSPLVVILIIQFIAWVVLPSLF
jgi:YggT family protein